MNDPLSALFSFVVAVSWQSSPVILLVLIIRHLLGPRISARWSHALWTLVLVRLLIPLSCLPSSSVSLQQIHALDAPIHRVQNVVEESLPPSMVTMPDGASVHRNATASPAITQKQREDRVMPWYSIAAFTWLSVMLGGLGLIVTAQVIFGRKIEATCAPIHDLAGATWDACCRRLKLTRVPQLRISSSVDSPMLIGLLRPRLVLPATTAESHTKEEYEHIFAHELGHYQRADHWTNALQLIILSIHWFNPLVWLSFWSARLDREMAADEWALRHLEVSNPQAYGRTLLKFISQQSSLGIIPATIGIAESKGQLKSRLRRIVRFGNRSGLNSILGFAALIILAIPALSSETNQIPSPAGRGTIYDRYGIPLAVNRPSDGKRIYPYEAFAAHLIGWLGHQEKQDANPAASGQIVGRHGVEAVMEPALKAGGAVYLTIDAHMQYIAETALRNAGATRAAVVIMDPRNGDVLALVSAPDFDPNTFIPNMEAKAWETLNNDPTAPLFNRAIHGYAPGSTYKILVSLAGLKSGRVSADTVVNCPGTISIGDHLFHNSDHSDAGTMNLVHAISVSNDVFFYQYGMKTGIDAIDEMGSRVGFGQKWGLLGDADEDAGIVPGPEWMKQNEEWLSKTHNSIQWSNAQTANTSIGQGFVLVTPLQLATFYSAVANGGTVYRPRLYDRIVAKGGQIDPADWIKKMTSPAQVFSTLDVKQSDLQAVQKGMLEAVQNGTGTLAQIPGIDIAGKTGTALSPIEAGAAYKRDLKTWFCCYAPYHSPRYTVTVMVEGGTWGGTTAAPIVQEILTRLFALEKGQKEEIKSLPPVKGVYDHLEDIVPVAPASVSSNR
jgi:cell division protein FtsI/penicillin-binding protein 2/beta-lactamase regulating signal transducer with metallopeptidase domain